MHSARETVFNNISPLGVHARQILLDPLEMFDITSATSEMFNLLKVSTANRERILNALSNRYGVIKTGKGSPLFQFKFENAALLGIHDVMVKFTIGACCGVVNDGIGDDCCSNFRHRLRSNGVNHV